MAFTPKNWQDAPNTSTPISALALKDLEARLSGYTDAQTSVISNLEQLVQGGIVYTYNGDLTNTATVTSDGTYVYSTTPAAGDSSTKAATTAFVTASSTTVMNAVTAETTRAENAEATLAPIDSPSLTGVATAPVLSITGLTGATSGARFVGATASGPPASGTFEQGDYIIALNGLIWICTLGGTPGNWTEVGGGTQGGSGAVLSVFGRTGAVNAQTGDYTVSEITGAAPLNSPTFTGVPTVPTAPSGTDNNQAASTAFVISTVANATGQITATQQSGTYTFSTSDIGQVVEYTGSGSVTFTIPANVLSTGDVIEVCQYGAGQITIAGGSGLTLHSPGGLVRTATQYATIGIRMRSATEAILSGDLA